MAAKPKGPKVPFDLHAGVRATSDAVFSAVTCLDLSPDGTTLAVATNNKLAFVGSTSELRGIEADHVAWSHDGSRIATLRGEWSGNYQTARIAVHSWPDGKLLARTEMSEWGTVSHALPGAEAPVFAWSSDGARLFVRSASMRDAHVSRIGVLDVASGELALHVLPGDAFLFSIATEADRVFALFADAREDAGLAWYDDKTFALRGRLQTVSGEHVIAVDGGAWVVGDNWWVWRVGGREKPAKPTITKRWERLQGLKARARAKWDVGYLEGCEIDESDIRIPVHEAGAEAFMHPEPWRIPQGARFGSDVIVRDGVRVALWRINEGALDVTPLIEDRQRATSNVSRLHHLSVRKNKLVLGWRKARSSNDTTCTFFDLDLGST